MKPKHFRIESEIDQFCRYIAAIVHGHEHFPFWCGSKARYPSEHPKSHSK